jgi:transposase
MRMPAAADKAWAGIDVGKRHHWVCVVDQDGRQLLSARVANDEAGIEAVIGSVTGLAGTITWAVDIIGAPSALLLAVLSQAGQHVRYASGRLVAAMSGAYAGEGKTDPKDAYVIAETARIRRNLPAIGPKRT